MNEQDLEQAAEIVGAMKDLFREFESRLGEIVSAQRIASSEARAEGAQVSKDLHELNRSARSLLNEQRDLVARLEREWQLRIDANAQRAGEAHAQAFGENITRGLQGQLEKLTADVKSATRRYTWRSSLQWALGIAIAIPLTVWVCVSAFLPHADPQVDKSNGGRPFMNKSIVGLPAVGLTAAQTREAVLKLSLCQVPKTSDWHVCIEVDNPPRIGLGALDKPRVVARGM
ncbi:MAG TPA: hypothetical protein VGC34_13665 [Steroidobacteraceae bacterium]